MPQNPQATVLAAVLLFATCHVFAQTTEVNPERGRLLGIIKAVDGDDTQRAQAIAAGAERSLLCGGCHGKDGNSVKPDTPNLAGQNPAYLLEQIELFATGQRKNFVMESLAANFSLTDKVNLAIYFSSMPVQPVAADVSQAGRGKRIFDAVCHMCHGTDGKGEAGFARIAGQQPLYVINTLKRYRANARHEVGAGEVKRTNPRMEQVSQSLTDAEIVGLANYIASLR